MSEPPRLQTDYDRYVKRPDELGLLAEDIAAAHERVVYNTGQALRFALECGELLAEAKSKVPHGGWEDWLDDHRPPGMSVTMARIYMRLHHHRSLLPDTTQTITGALQALAGQPNQSPAADKRAAAQALRRERPELTVRAIADRLGEPPSSVQLWLNPKTERKQAARYLAKRRRKTITCPHCGGLLHNDGSKPEQDNGPP